MQRGEAMSRSLRHIRRELGVKRKRNTYSIAYSQSGQQLYPNSLNAFFRDAELILKHPRFEHLVIFIKGREIATIDILRSVKLYHYGQNDYRYIIFEGKNYFLHRIIAEAKYQRLIRKSESVHHIDNDKFNNMPDNLQIMTKKAHKALHRKERNKHGN